MRKYGRVDANQKKITEQLRSCGFSVAVTSSMGKGFPDLVVGAKNNNYLFEIKDPNQPPSKRLLTMEEHLFKQSWKGQYDVIETIDDILKIIDKK